MRVVARLTAVEQAYRRAKERDIAISAPKIVPAVTDVRWPHAAHMMRPSPSRQQLPGPHSGHTDSCGHRTHSR